MNVTDNEIIKAWEKILATGDAPVGEHWSCGGVVTTKLAKETYDMLNRQKAEVERLQERSERAADNLKAVLNERSDHTEAIKDFSEEYKDHIKSFTGIFSPQLGFAVSLDAVLTAVDFVCENYKKIKGELC